MSRRNYLFCMAPEAHDRLVTEAARLGISASRMVEMLILGEIAWPKGTFSRMMAEGVVARKREAGDFLRGRRSGT